MTNHKTYQQLNRSIALHTANNLGASRMASQASAFPRDLKQTKLMMK